MNTKKINIFILLPVILIYFSAAFPTYGESKLNVTATLSTFADIVKTIGGDHVSVKYIASPGFDPHFIQPKPTDVLKVKRADLFIHAGLDLELWREPLVTAAGNPAVRTGAAGELDLSKGVPLLQIPVGTISRAEGDIHIFGNPHYWMDPQSGILMARSVARKLIELDPKNRESYQRSLDHFSKDLSSKMKQWKNTALPHAGKSLIGYHNEWVYLIEFLGLKMDDFLEPKPGIPPTPRHLLTLIKAIKEKHIEAIVQASFFPRDAAVSLSKKTGIKHLVLCQNVNELPPCKDYISMLDYNIKTILGAL